MVDTANISSDDTCRHEFSYDKLDIGSKIRLLDLLPGRFMDSLSCELHNDDLDCLDTGYEALSYVWGDPQPVCPILLNGADIKITRNLEEALRHLRYAETSRRLWIDALCINQKNDQEKSHQVRQMHRVYGHAERVIAWLGPDTEDIGIAFDVLTRLQLDNDLELIHEWTENRQDAILEAARQDRSWSAISALPTRPYWRRGWIVQELAYAKSVIVMAGHQSISWSTLHDAAMVLMYARKDPFVSDLDLGKISHIAVLGINICEMKDNPTKQSLVHIIETFGIFDTSDGRDRVYAFVNLPSREDKTDFKFDYGLEVEEVYESFACWSIRSSLTFDVLSHVRGETDKDEKGTEVKVRFKNLGSWVPRWSEESYRDGKTVPLVNNMTGNVPQLYHASGYSKIRMNPFLGEVYPKMKYYLGTRGYKVDRVSEIGRVLTHSDAQNARDFAALPVIREWQNMVDDLALKSHRYPSEAINADGITLARMKELFTVDLHNSMNVVAKAEDVGKIRIGVGHPSQQSNADKRSVINQSTAHTPFQSLEAAARDKTPLHFRFPTTNLERVALLEAFARTLICNRSLEPWSKQGDSVHYGSNLDTLAFYNRWRNGKVYEARNATLGDIHLEHLYILRAASICQGRRLIITETGYMGLAPADTSIGDTICVIEGSQTPFMLYKAGTWHHDGHEAADWHFVGDCYVHGIMDGEAWQDTEKVKPEQFVIR